MEYELLDEEQQLEITKGVMMQIEADHLRATMEHDAAVAQAGNKPTEEQQARIDTLKDAVDDLEMRHGSVSKAKSEREKTKPEKKK
jgi:putative heme iron utilization protein